MTDQFVTIFPEESAYRFFLQAMTDYSFHMLDPRGYVVSWNAAAERMNGYAAAEIIGRHFSQFHCAEDRAANLAQHCLDSILRDGRFEREMWRMRKDGTRFWVNTVMEPVRDNDGNLIGFMAVIRDRSEKRHLQEENKRTEQGFRLLVEGITDYAIYMLDPDGIVSNWNAGAERAKGYSADEIVGSHFSRFYSDEDVAAGLPQQSLEKALRHGRFEAEGWRLRKDGSRFWAHVVIDAIREENGELVGFAKITRDRTAHNESAAKIAYMARYDGLTGLLNRTSFIERLDASLSMVSGSRRVAVINIDLDRFKDINDTYGHATGDKVLSTLAQRMRDVCTEDEIIGRFGGDEFLLAKAFSDEQHLQDFVQRLQKALTEMISLDQTDLIPGASLGIAIYPTDATSRDKLLNNADLAMYRAKANLVEKICFYEQAMDEASRARRALARDLWTAIEEEQFFLHYQIQRAASTEEITGYEVLLRWNHPTRGLIPPAEFIPVAEECGAISALGDWVLETACREAMEWPLQHRIAINLSPLQLGNPVLVEKVRRVLLKTGLSASRLEFEVTETAIIADKARALHILRQLRAMGVTIAIDDFGTGYSSLEALRSFPFDKIKLDRSFIGELGTNRQAKAFVRAMLALGKSLGVSVLAEGVETKDQLDILIEEGCGEVQGFYLGRPDTLPHVIAKEQGHRAGESSGDEFAGERARPAPVAKRG